ncbi:MAG TPA: hypothetical protein VJ397_07895 [Thermoplasmata archaeon]|nr:hypothetical protein [Thermoplasmata archaeon]
MKGYPRPPVPGGGDLLPRRKYGRMIKPLPIYDEKKCRFCRAGRTCPVHRK